MMKGEDNDEHEDKDKVENDEGDHDMIWRSQRATKEIKWVEDAARVRAKLGEEQGRIG